MLGVKVISMRILYITRKYPPSVGGMQKFNFYLTQNLKELANLELISWGGSQKWLPLVIPYFFIKASWVLLRKRVGIIHLGDASLSPLALVLKHLFNRSVTVTVHGLDITWKFQLYQLLVPGCLKRLDKVICVSQQTKKECLARGVNGQKIVIIPSGVDPQEFQIEKNQRKIRKLLQEKVKVKLQGKKILLSVGRLVERKGFHWFISEVLPTILNERRDVAYLIAGGGPLKNRIRESVRKNGLENHAFLLGAVDHETLKLLYNASAVFVMPNVKVKGDMEGFGIVALEAASCRLPVVASNLEGIKDAIKHEKNGFLIEPYNAQEFANVIIKLLKNDEKRQKFGKEAMKFVLKNYNWKKTSERYLEEFARMGAG